MDKHRQNSKMKRQAKPGADVPCIIYLNNVLKNLHFVPNLATYWEYGTNKTKLLFL